MPKKIVKETVASTPVRVPKAKAAKPASTVEVTSKPRVRSVKHSKAAAPVANEVTVAAVAENVVDASAHEQIAKIAFGYYAARGYQDGFHEEDWLSAEKEYLLSI